MSVDSKVRLRWLPVRVEALAAQRQLPLAKAGADVVINDLNMVDAESVATEIRKLGRKTLTAPTDVSDPAAVDTLVEQAVTQLGGIDIVVTNAAFSDREAFCQADLSKFQRTLDVTMWGAFYVLRAVARQMIAQGAAVRPW